MQEGEVSTVLTIGDQFFIVQMYEIEVDQELVEEYTQNVTERFITERREEAFFDVIDGWVATANIQRNERALRRF
jgi:hypothetical protein